MAHQVLDGARCDLKCISRTGAAKNACNLVGRHDTRAVFGFRIKSYTFFFASRDEQKKNSYCMMIS